MKARTDSDTEYSTPVLLKFIPCLLSNLFFLILISSTTLYAQEYIDYEQDTIWLKSGLVVPCKIIEDSTNSDYIYVDFVNAFGKIDHSRFAWKQINLAHKQSETYGHFSTIYNIELNDGTILTGNIVNETETQIDIHLADIGILKIQRDKIKRMISVDASKKDRKSFWFKNPHATRLLFAPTAIPLERGEGYYQNTYLIVNMFNYGVGNNFSIGGGFDFITMFGNIAQDEWRPMLNFNIKSGFKVSENFHLGIGGLYLTMPSEFSAGIIYGISTIGSYNTNLTVGLGWGFSDDGFEGNPFITFGGMARLSERIWLISENWLAPVDGHDYYFVFSYGVRFAAKRIAVDLAFVNNRDFREFMVIGVPFVSFVVKFGKN